MAGGSGAAGPSDNSRGGRRASLLATSERRRLRVTLLLVGLELPLGGGEVAAGGRSFGLAAEVGGDDGGRGVGAVVVGDGASGRPAPGVPVAGGKVAEDRQGDGGRVAGVEGEDLLVEGVAVAAGGKVAGVGGKGRDEVVQAGGIGRGGKVPEEELARAFPSAAR